MAKRIILIDSGSSMAAWSPLITGNRIAPNPNAETFQSNLPTYDISFLHSSGFAVRAVCSGNKKDIDL